LTSREKSFLIILGSGLYGLFKESIHSKTISLDTAFGKAQVTRLDSPDNQVYIMMRHGPRHAIPPHLINFRANLAAAKKLNVTHIVATSSVGSLRKTIPVGSFVVLDQFIDFTKGRPSSVFFDRPENFVHTDMTDPYSSNVRSALITSLKKNKVRLFRSSGTYVCTEGPRFETPAEIRMFAKLGGDVVGMTGVPEVVIANELGLDYGNLSIVSNMAAGLQQGVISPEEVISETRKHLVETKAVLETAVKELSNKKT